jgi:hypothetical protein
MYATNFSADNCAKCGEGIANDRPGCTALNQTFHLACFTCSECGKELAGGSFYALEGKPYCESDYMVRWCASALDHYGIIFL